MAATGWTCSMSSKLVYVVFLTFLQLNQFNGDVNIELHRRFEYKYSFKPPYLAQKDGTVPFWEYGGSKYNHTEKKRKRKKKSIQSLHTRFFLHLFHWSHIETHIHQVEVKERKRKISHHESTKTRQLNEFDVVVNRRHAFQSRCTYISQTQHIYLLLNFYVYFR